MSPALMILGISIIGTWGLASLGLVVGGLFLIFWPGNPTTDSSAMAGGIVLLCIGLVSGGLMQWMVMPLLGLDLPVPIRAKSILPFAKMTNWANAGYVRDLPDGTPKEVRLHSQRVTLIRKGDDVHALGGLCTHARLPLAGIPGSPIKPYEIQEDCVMCPFHGARFDITNGHCVRQPFSTQFNNDHPFLGRFQEKLFFWNKKAEDIQTYPVEIENGQVRVGLPK